MSQVETQMAEIRDVQNERGIRENSDPARIQFEDEILNPLSFIIEIDPSRPVTGIEHDMAKILPGILFHLEAIYTEKADPVFFGLTITSVSFYDLSGSPFTLTYYLSKMRGIVSVEVDMETDLHPWQSEIEASSEEIAGFSSFCFKNPQIQKPPADFAWALRSTRVDEAWNKFGVTGKGIKLAQIDSGLAEHVEFDDFLIDPSLGLNMYDTRKGAVDPLSKRFLGFDQLGHGTAVGSVIISKGGLDTLSTTAPGRISGVAQNIEYLPIRAIRSVIRLRQSKVAKAIRAAVDAGAHIISMSLGGIPSKLLKQALRYAEQANVIILAASGNCVPKVVFPAAYRSCVAVSGINIHGKAWKGASTGPEVDFSAPAEYVYHARRSSPKDKNFKSISPGQGTSFAVAISAGIAALWLEHFGRAALIKDLAPNEFLMDRFVRFAKLTSNRGVNWPTNELGAGIIDACALLEKDPFDGGGHISFSPHVASFSTGKELVHVEIILNYFPELNNQMGFSATTPTLSPEEIERCGQEIIWRVLKAHQQLSSPLPPASDELTHLSQLHPILSIDVHN